MLATITKDQRVSFWKSVQHGFPLLCLIMGDYITLSKPSEDGAGTFMDIETFRLIVFGGAYVLSVWTIYLRRVDFLSLMQGHWSLILFLIYAFSSFFWSAFPDKVLTACSHLLGAYLVAAAGLLMFRGNEVSLIRVYCMFSYVFIPACLVTGFYFPDRNIHVQSGRWMALTLNPNTLGAATMICVWANMSYLLYARNVLMRLWVVLTIIGAFGLLVGAGSVTSMGLSILAVLGIPLFYWFAKSGNAVIATFRISYTSLIIFAVLGYFYATQPELFDMNRSLDSVGRQSNLTGRTTLWAIANAAIDARPFIGWSFDSLSSLPSKYSINTNQFHNGYLDLMVRGGMIGLGFIIFFAATTVLRIIRLAPGKKAMSASFGTLLVLILLHNISETSLASAPNPLWLLFTFIYIAIVPRIFKWHETGVLDEASKWKWGQSPKESNAPAEAPILKSYASPTAKWRAPVRG